MIRSDLASFANLATKFPPKSDLQRIQLACSCGIDPRACDQVRLDEDGAHVWRTPAGTLVERDGKWRVE